MAVRSGEGAPPSTCSFASGPPRAVGIWFSFPWLKPATSAPVCGLALNEESHFIQRASGRRRGTGHSAVDRRAHRTMAARTCSEKTVSTMRRGRGNEGRGDVEGPDGLGTQSCWSGNHSPSPRSSSRRPTGAVYFLFAHSFTHSATGTWEQTCLSSCVIHPHSPQGPSVAGAFERKRKTRNSKPSTNPF